MTHVARSAPGARNYPQNFRSAFGESIDDFQGVLDRRLEQLLK
jgi:hypothetical protein